MTRPLRCTPILVEAQPPGHGRPPVTDLAEIWDLQIETFPPAPLETSETRRVVLHFRLPVETPAQLVGARLPLCLLRLCDLPRQARPGPGSVGPGSISP